MSFSSVDDELQRFHCRGLDYGYVSYIKISSEIILWDSISWKERMETLLEMLTKAMVSQDAANAPMNEEDMDDLERPGIFEISDKLLLAIGNSTVEETTAKVQGLIQDDWKKDQLIAKRLLLLLALMVSYKMYKMVSKDRKSVEAGQASRIQKLVHTFLSNSLSKKKDKMKTVLVPKVSGMYPFTFECALTSDVLLGTREYYRFWIEKSDQSYRMYHTIDLILMQVCDYQPTFHEYVLKLDDSDAHLALNYVCRVLLMLVEIPILLRKKRIIFDKNQGKKLIDTIFQFIALRRLWVTTHLIIGHELIIEAACTNARQNHWLENRKLCAPAFLPMMWSKFNHDHADYVAKAAPESLETNNTVTEEIIKIAEGQDIAVFMDLNKVWAKLQEQFQGVNELPKNKYFNPSSGPSTTSLAVFIGLEREVIATSAFKPYKEPESKRPRIAINIPSQRTLPLFSGLPLFIDQHLELLRKLHSNTIPETEESISI